MVGVMGRTVLATATTASGGAVEAAASRGFITSDGARLPYLEAGPAGGQTVPGWTMALQVTAAPFSDVVWFSALATP